MNYKYINKNNKLRTDMILLISDDGTVMFVPGDVRNKHWKEYQAWLAQGNMPLPADS